MQESFDSGFYAIESIARELSDYSATVDLDPTRLGEVRRRRDLLFRLTKKYGPTVADVIAAGRDAKRELDLLDTAAMVAAWSGGPLPENVRGTTVALSVNYLAPADGEDPGGVVAADRHPGN